MRSLPAPLTLLLGFAFAGADLSARVEVLIAEPGSEASAASCVSYLRKRIHAPFLRKGYDFENHIGVVRQTREQIYETYRRLGTVPAAELLSIQLEDRRFPAQAVLYVRSVNDLTNEVEGILRIVSGELGYRRFFNHPYSVNDRHRAAEIPVYCKYEDPEFRAFIHRRFPHATEFGRVVFGNDVNELRVLIDLTVGALEFCHFTDGEVADHVLIAEAVKGAVPRYATMGLDAVKDCPITLHDDRVLMAAPMSKIFALYAGNVNGVVNRFRESNSEETEVLLGIIGQLDAVSQNVSSSRRIQEAYTYALFQQTLLFYSVGEFERMAANAQELIRRNEGSGEFRLLALFAETSRIFDFSKGKGGDADAAIVFLNAESTRERYGDSAISSDLNPGMIPFLKGLIFLQTNRFILAKSMRREIARLRLGRRNLSPVDQALRRVALLEQIWNPATRLGDAVDLLAKIEMAKQEHSVGLTSQIYDLEAKALRAVNRTAEARRSEIIADGIRISAEDENSERRRQLSARP